MPSKKMPRRLVSSEDEARENIRRFEAALEARQSLAEILAYARAWYACRNDDGHWVLGPSKFIGYENNSADTYLKGQREGDGRLTERVLSHWFKAVEPGSALREELTGALRRLFVKFGKTPNKLTRLSVLESDLGSLAARRGPRDARPAGRDRITIDPKVCGGRPCIRGMRIRVGDILEMLAEGAQRAEILADFPYLEGADIDAALDYAARAVDHRVIQAA
jgi:uncharacterized protein (DUF433 family)